LVTKTGKQNKTAILTGTAIMAALVIVFDYSLKYSGLKIPFPWYPNLKFDFTGIPIIMSLFMYGFSPAITTSIVAGLGIFMRSGNWISASMKSLYVLPNFWGYPWGVTVGLLPLIAAFNIIQGLVTIGLGHFLFQAVKARLPNWSDNLPRGWF